MSVDNWGYEHYRQRMVLLKNLDIFYFKRLNIFKSASPPLYFDKGSSVTTDRVRSGNRPPLRTLNKENNSFN